MIYKKYFHIYIRNEDGYVTDDEGNKLDLLPFVRTYKFQSGSEQPIRYLELIVDKNSIDSAYPKLIEDSIVNGKTQLEITAVGRGTFIVSKIWLTEFQYEFMAYGKEVTINTASLTYTRENMSSVDIAKSIAESLLGEGNYYFSPSFYDSNGNLYSPMGNTMTMRAGMSSILALQMCALSEGAFIFFGEYDNKMDILYFIKYGDDVPIASNPSSPNDGVLNVYPDYHDTSKEYSVTDLMMSDRVVDVSSKSPEGISSIVNAQSIQYTNSDTSIEEIANGDISYESQHMYGEFVGNTIEAGDMVCTSAVAKRIANSLISRYKDPSQSIVIGMKEVYSDSVGISWDMAFSCYAYVKAINDDVNKIYLTNTHICDGTEDDFVLRLSMFTRAYPEMHTYYTFGVSKQTSLSQELANIKSKSSSMTTTLLSAVLPIGAVYWLDSTMNPSDVLSFGTWEEISQSVLPNVKAWKRTA